MAHVGQEFLLGAHRGERRVARDLELSGPLGNTVLQIDVQCGKRVLGAQFPACLALKRARPIAARALGEFGRGVGIQRRDHQLLIRFANVLTLAAGRQSLSGIEHLAI